MLIPELPYLGVMPLKPVFGFLQVSILIVRIMGCRNEWIFFWISLLNLNEPTVLNTKDIFFLGADVRINLLTAIS